jgi:Holliday junction resolvase-like predicted endonuclease
MTVPAGKYNIDDIDESLVTATQFAALHGLLTPTSPLQARITEALKDWRARHPEFDGLKCEFDFYTGIAGGKPGFIVEVNNGK